MRGTGVPVLRTIDIERARRHKSSAGQTTSTARSTLPEHHRAPHAGEHHEHRSLALTQGEHPVAALDQATSTVLFLFPWRGPHAGCRRPVHQADERCARTMRNWILPRPRAGGRRTIRAIRRFSMKTRANAVARLSHFLALEPRNQSLLSVEADIS
jgi:hypothetical protein